MPLLPGIISVQETWPGRGGSLEFPQHRKYIRCFEVITDSPYVDTLAAGSAPGIVMGDEYPLDRASLAVSIVPTQHDDSPQHWTVTVTYDSEPNWPKETGPDGKDQPDKPDIPDNPLNKPPEWKYSFQQTTQVVRRAYAKDDGPFVDAPIFGPTIPIMNSAKLPFDPPVTIEVSRPIISVTKNRPAMWFDHSKVDSMQDAVNSKKWWNIDPRCARCVGIESDFKRENGVWFWATTHTFAIKYDTWDIRALDCGTAELLPGDIASPGNGNVATPERYATCRDAFGHEYGGPVPFDGNGRKLAPTAAPVFNRWRVYRERDFNKFVV